jgi:hypothetical protein
MKAEPLLEPESLATWGDLFEVAVKRGCLDLLLHRGLLPDAPHLAPWAETQVADLISHLHRQLGITDPATRRRYAHALQHLLMQGWGLGWTVLRGALDRLVDPRLEARGLYCPLSLPVRPGEEPDNRAHEVLWRSLQLPGAPDPAWLGRGQPARADFLLWLHDQAGHQQIFVLEFSLNTPPEARDLRDMAPHLDELFSYAQRLESRGVFARVGATLTSEQFAFSDRIVAHLGAFTTRDKPLYKLAQASAYATNFLLNLHERRLPAVPATAHAIAVTNSGVEALEAEFSGRPNPRWSLMRALAEAYPRVPHPGDDDPEALDREIAAVRNQIVRSLPDILRDQVGEALEVSSSSRSLRLRLTEPVDSFANPAALIDRDILAAGVDESTSVCALLGSSSPRADLAAECGPGPATTLRQLHTAAIRRVIASAPRGRITVLAAEGMPGIGKTYSVRKALKGLPEGFLWLYASPRLLINEEVLRDVVSTEGGIASNVVALTTNSRLIGGASAWWRPRQLASERRKVDGAVLCLGTSTLVHPRGSTLFVDEDQAHEIDAGHAGSSLSKRTLDEGTDEMHPAQVNGVLRTLAGAARDLLDKNLALNRLVLAASIQGFRHIAGSGSRKSVRTTVDRLSNLFHERAGTPSASFERAEFARRIPTVVVMVDEIAGDGAGAPFVHELGDWLHREFIAPFEGTAGGSPFRVVLVLADASLSNDDVMTSYLDQADDAPEKVIVSPSRGASPFRVTARDLRIGGRLYPALHVMADGFPARKLSIDYQVRLTPVEQDAQELASTVAARALIARQCGDRMRHTAIQSIFDALQLLPPGQQVIFFAQNKMLLRDIRKALLNPDAPVAEEMPPVESHGVALTGDEVAILDSSVPEAERKRLMTPSVRDHQRVFLMTSSGARGVSFPNAATIIAMVPLFAVESGFMEIAQLVYRGRGGSGDFLDRRLIMLLDDFVVADGAIDDRQWLRRTLDLLSALLLLRATLLTRVTGDAGLRKQRAAIVPVGRVGAEELATSLPQAVGPFLRESALYLREASDPDLQALVDRAEGAVRRLFADFTQEARIPRDRASVTQREFLDQMARQVTADHARLLNRAHPPSLPDHIFAAGPIWIESWSGLPMEEGIEFRALTDAEIQEIQDLRGRLYGITREYTRLPGALTRAARDLLKLVDRREGLRERRFRVKRNVDDARLWLCVPLDYLSFMYVENEYGRQQRTLEEDAQPLWHQALSRAAWAAAPLLAEAPVIPRYRAFPYLSFQTTGDPTGLERAFDSRYFMASTELNLLNTILFVD